MAVVFYIIGGIGIAGGLLWSVGAVGIASSAGLSGGQAIEAGATLAGLIAAAPGIGLTISSLLLLAVGGVLARLDRIVWNTAGEPDQLAYAGDTSRWSARDRAKLQARRDQQG